MVMSYLFTGLILLSVLFSLVLGRGSALSQAVLEGAQSGIRLAISISGSICLWCGVGKLMEKTGISGKIAHILSPILKILFPSTKTNPKAAGYISVNICANLLGLGNAATPLGIEAVRHLQNPRNPRTATHEMCRLVVLNTASIQLIPANVAAVRASLGCTTPFDILPCVWFASICSAGMGLAAAWLLGKRASHD